MLPVQLTKSRVGYRVRGLYMIFPLSPFASDNLVTIHVRLSHPALARSFSIVRLNHQSAIINQQSAISNQQSAISNLVLILEIPTAFRTSSTYNRQPPSGQSRVYQVTQLPTDGVHHPESAGTGPVVLNVVPVTGPAFSGFTMGQFLFAYIRMK